MAMKCRGMQSTTNYDHQDYEHLLPKLEKLSKVCCLPVPCHMPLVQVQASPADEFCSDLSNAALYKMSWQRLTAAGLPSVIASASAAFRLVVMLTCIQSCSKLHSNLTLPSFHRRRRTKAWFATDDQPPWYLTMRLRNQHAALLQDDVRQLLMRKASTFTRGSSNNRGVTKHKVAHRTFTPVPSRLPSSPSTTPHTTPQSSLYPPQVQCSALRSPALPCPALPCPALPCPACPALQPLTVSLLTYTYNCQYLVTKHCVLQTVLRLPCTQTQAACAASFKRYSMSDD